MSPAFHAWCNQVVRGGLAEDDCALVRLLEREFGRLHHKLDRTDRDVADLLMLLVSAQDLVLDQRRPFSEGSKQRICEAIASEAFEDLCPCCSRTPVLTSEGRPAAGAEFDHFYHRGLNRAEFGWLVCKACHHELIQGGYLARHGRIGEFRRCQQAVHDGKAAFARRFVRCRATPRQA